MSDLKHFVSEKANIMAIRTDHGIRVCAWNGEGKPESKALQEALPIRSYLTIFSIDCPKTRGCLLTRSLTIIPSSLATAILKIVLITRKNECSTTIPVSLDRNLGNAIRNKMACNCRMKDMSMLGLADSGRRGKCLASETSLSFGVGLIFICTRPPSARSN